LTCPCKFVRAPCTCPPTLNHLTEAMFLRPNPHNNKRISDTREERRVVLEDMVNKGNQLTNFCLYNFIQYRKNQILHAMSKITYIYVRYVGCVQELHDASCELLKVWTVELHGGVDLSSFGRTSTASGRCQLLPVSSSTVSHWA
jgi:hypothetical protein